MSFYCAASAAGGSGIPGVVKVSYLIASTSRLKHRWNNNSDEEAAIKFRRGISSIVHCQIFDEFEVFQAGIINNLNLFIQTMDLNQKKQGA
jgi:hypothetical protein